MVATTTRRGRGRPKLYDAVLEVSETTDRIRELDRRAEAQGVTRSDVVRAALADYLNSDTSAG